MLIRAVSSSDSILLVSAHQYVDKSGSSYYGREKLFLYNGQAKNFSEVVTYEGVLHNVALDCRGDTIAVTSGKMPAYTVLYNSKGAPFYLLNNDFRNRIYFAPNEELVAVAGFGSLNGEIEIWDYSKQELIAKSSSSRSSFIKWSFSSKMYMTAVVAEKLKVDHRISIFKFDGTPIKKINLEVFDLINVDFAHKCPPVKSLVSTNNKKKVESGGLLGASKRMPGKIEVTEIEKTNKGTFKPPVDNNPAPSLQVGNGSTNRFFNSKKNENNSLKFKKGG